MLGSSVLKEARSRTLLHARGQKGKESPKHLDSIWPVSQNPGITLTLFSELSSHVEKEGEGTERCMSPQKSIVEQCFRKRASGSGVQQLQCGGKPVYGEGSHETP